MYTVNGARLIFSNSIIQDSTSEFEGGVAFADETSLDVYVPRGLRVEELS